MSAKQAVGAGPAEDATVGVRVARRIAEVLGVSPTDLEPLHHSVDTDALEALHADGVGPRVEFRSNGCRVVVGADGRVEVERLTDD